MASKKTKKGKGAGGAKPVKISKPVETTTSEIALPTPEQLSRVTYGLGKVKDEMGRSVGFAYRRRPLFETMASKGAIGTDELEALRFYRTTFDRCDRSPIRSCLDVDGNGVARADAVALMRTKSVLEAKRRLKLCEKGMAGALATMRAVALEDMSFSQVAMIRFGCRVTRYEKFTAEERAEGKHREVIRPRSNRDRAVISLEFHAGLKVLTDTVRQLTTRHAVDELWIQPEQDGTASIRRGNTAPQGMYRCWGDGAKIDAIVNNLRRRHGNTLRFNSIRHARTALNRADHGRLQRMEAHEMGA